MDSITKLRKVGGSLVATIPKSIVELESLNEGQTVKIKVEKVKKSFFGAAKGIGSFTKEDKKWIEGKHLYD
jgi:antitoxin component of MazEF toxin-antitoxin module